MAENKVYENKKILITLDAEIELITGNIDEILARDQSFQPKEIDTYEWIRFYWRFPCEESGKVKCLAVYINHCWWYAEKIRFSIYTGQ